MASPRGDHAGWPSLSPQRVSTRGAARVVSSSHSAVLLVFFSMSGVVTAHTARRPSGASATPPTRCSRHSVSTSSGRGVARAGRAFFMPASVAAAA